MATALVVGGAGGIGLETVRLLGERGDSVVLADIDSARAQQAAKEDLKGSALEGAWIGGPQPPLSIDPTRFQIEEPLVIAVYSSTVALGVSGGEHLSAHPLSLNPTGRYPVVGGG